MWIVQFLNFDTILQALNTLFVLASGDGWSDYLAYMEDPEDDG